MEDTTRFRPQYRPLSDMEKADIDDIKHDALVLSATITASLDDCRERSIALTKLEEAVMWAVRGVTK